MIDINPINWAISIFIIVFTLLFFKFIRVLIEKNKKLLEQKIDFDRKEKVEKLKITQIDYLLKHAQAMKTGKELDIEEQLKTILGASIEK